MSPIVIVGAGLLVLLIGAGLGYWLGSVSGRKEVAKSAAELDDYRREVTEHFSATAEHFRSIGAEYQKLYRHMASGEAALCNAGQGIAFESPEKLTFGETVEAAEPPRDYDIAETDADDTELPEIVEEGPAETVLADDEPTDLELARTEAAEELLAGDDHVGDASKAEKTLH